MTHKHSCSFEHGLDPCKCEEHDPECIQCEHDCPWKGNPIGAPFCSICDDHMEAEAARHDEDCAIWKSTLVDCTCGERG